MYSHAMEAMVEKEPSPIVIVDFVPNCRHIRNHMARSKHRRPVRKDQMIRLRVTSEQRSKLIVAADAAGLTLSSWLLSVGLKATEHSAH